MITNRFNFVKEKIKIIALELFLSVNDIEENVLNWDMVSYKVAEFLL